MKKFLTFLISLFFIFPLSAAGFKLNFGLTNGFSECTGGKQVQKNVNFWDDFSEFGHYLDYGGFVTADIIFLKDSDIEIGFEYQRTSLNFLSLDGIKYSNGITNISFSQLKIPVLYKFSLPLSKTKAIINSLDFSAGMNFSFILGEQAYKDELTTDVGNFIHNSFNIGLSAKINYSQKLGQGYFFAGIGCDYNLLPYTYQTSINEVNTGRTFSVSPFIGYTFVIKENDYQARITEQSKRITDMDVQ